MVSVNRMRAAAAAALLVCVPAQAQAQQPVPADTAHRGGTEVRALAPVFLEPGHWAYGALRRLHVAGVAPAASDPAVAPVTLQHVAAVLDSAAAHLEATQPLLAARARHHLQLLAAEMGAPASPLVLGVRAGWHATGNEAFAGDGYCKGLAGESFCEDSPADWQGALPMGDASAAAFAVRAHGHVLPWLAWSVDGGRLAGEWRLLSGAVSAAAGPLDVWAGRRRLHYGAGTGGGIVIGSGMHEVTDVAFRSHYDFDGVGVHVREPFHFPGFLRVLGATRVEMVASRLPRMGQVDNPWAVFGRLFVSPFSPRLTLGVNRGAVFGGDGIPLTVPRLAGLLFGMHGGDVGEFENQVFSAIARYRPPLGSLPLELWVEAGMDDTSGAIRNVPTYVAGIDTGPLPWLPALSVGLEHTRYSQSCCGNPIWYRHFFYRGSWADRGRLIAHPLGGHGYEWLGRGELEMPEVGLLLRGAAALRHRGQENLFAPEREGRSVAGSVGVEYRFAGGTSLHVNGLLERGSGWDMHRFTAMLAHPLLVVRAR